MEIPVTITHKWKLDVDGNPDVWAYDNDGHNGVKCRICGVYICVHCHSRWESEPGSCL